MVVIFVVVVVLEWIFCLFSSVGLLFCDWLHSQPVCVSCGQKVSLTS